MHSLHSTEVYYFQYNLPIQYGKEKMSHFISDSLAKEFSGTHLGCIYILTRDLHRLASFREKHMPLLVVTRGELDVDALTG